MICEDIVIKIASLKDNNPQAVAHYHMFCDDDMFVPFIIDAHGQRMESSFSSMDTIHINNTTSRLAMGHKAIARRWGNNDKSSRNV